VVQSSEKFSKEIKKTVELGYLKYLPKTATGKKYPLVLFLHGAGERGSDPEKLKSTDCRSFLSKNLAC